MSRNGNNIGTFQKFGSSLKQIRQANIRNGGHLEEMQEEELFGLRKKNELLNGKVENGGIRNQIANAVNGVKDV